MTLNEDLSKIIKISIFSIIALLAIGVVSYFTFSASLTLAIVISGATAFIAFIATLFFYYMIYRGSSPSKIKYVLYVYIGKILFFVLVFYLMTNLKSINLMYFIISFLVFFIIFFNIEILLIYKKILFRNY